MRLTEGGEMAMWLAVGGFWATVVLGPIGKALARRIGGAKPESTQGLSTGEMNAERVAAMEERLLELEAERDHLEERVDFAERMLTQAKADSRGLAEGGSP